MNNVGALVIYLAIGMVGGIIGEKLKIPAGAMIGSTLAVILFKFFRVVFIILTAPFIFQFFSQTP